MNIRNDFGRVDDDFEKRGVTFALFQALRDYALMINPDRTYWTIARVSAVLIGNHEILKPGHRFAADVSDPSTTLTFSKRMSLINLLQSDYNDDTTKHPFLNVCYREVVGAKATIYVSFAYGDNFIELVEALDVFRRPT